MLFIFLFFFTVPCSNVKAEEIQRFSPTKIELAANTTTNTEKASFNLTATDTSKAQKTVTYYLYMFGGSIIAFAMGLVAIRMILTKNSDSKREETMTALGKIILGCGLLGSCILISGFLVGVANHIGSVLTNGSSSVINSPTANITDDDGNFITKAFANIFTSIEKCVFNLFSTYFGFLPLDKLIFNSKANVFGITGTISVPPFTDTEWSNLNYMYLRVTSICAPIVLIMVGKSAISLIMSANKPAQRSEFQEDICRWLFSLALIAVGPILLRGLFLFASYMTDAVVAMFNASFGKDNYVTNISMVDSIQTGSVLTSAIVKCLFAWKYFQINMLFLVRKIVLTAMYAFTPLAALFWGIDNKTQAIQIWFGEMITNAVMQFFYAFTFSIMIISLSGSSWKNWFYSIIWIFSLVKIAEVFRNSLQGLFTKLAGVDEMAIAGKSFGPVSAAASGAIGAISRTFRGSSASKISEGMRGFRSSPMEAAVFGGTGRKNTEGVSGTVNPLDRNVASKMSDNGKNNIGDTNSETASNSNGNMDTKNANKVKEESITGNPQAAGNTAKEDGSPDFEFESTDAFSDPFMSEGGDTSGVGTGSNIGSSGESEGFSANADSDTEGYKNDIPFGNSTVDTNGFNGVNTVPPITDSKGNVNMDNLRAASSRHRLYSSMLNDNLKKYAANRPAGAKILGEISRAGNFRNETMANRVIAGKAINATVKDMQSLAGGVDKLSKQDALSQLFGGDIGKSSTQAAHDRTNEAENTVSRNINNFKSAISRGDMGRASQIMDSASPMNNLSLKQKSAVIAHTDPYTNVDGFRW